MKKKAFRALNLLTSKPVLYVCNVDEDSAANGNDYSKLVEKQAADEGAVSVIISAQIEEEVAQLPDEERAEFLADLGLDEPGLNRLIRSGYELLHLITYFTAGPKEARAWTIRAGMVAPQAAGVIHTDFEKGFIRAETIAYDDFVSGWAVSRGPKKRARCVLKVRNMWSLMAISCISASPIKRLIAACLRRAGSFSAAKAWLLGQRHQRLAFGNHFENWVSGGSVPKTVCQDACPARAFFLIKQGVNIVLIGDIGI